MPTYQSLSQKHRPHSGCRHKSRHAVLVLLAHQAIAAGPLPVGAGCQQARWDIWRPKLERDRRESRCSDNTAPALFAGHKCESGILGNHPLPCSPGSPHWPGAFPGRPKTPQNLGVRAPRTASPHRPSRCAELLPAGGCGCVQHITRNRDRNRLPDPFAHSSRGRGSGNLSTVQTWDGGPSCLCDGHGQSSLRSTYYTTFGPIVPNNS